MIVEVTVVLFCSPPYVWQEKSQMNLMGLACYDSYTDAV